MSFAQHVPVWLMFTMWLAYFEYSESIQLNLSSKKPTKYIGDTCPPAVNVLPC